MSDQQAGKEPMVFDDLAPVEVQVTFGKKEYVLREALEDEARQYRDAVAKATKFSDGEMTGVEGIGSVQLTLIQLCLWEKMADGVERRIPMCDVKRLKAKHAKAIFERIMDISDLREEETVPQLEKSIARMQKRLNKLRAGPNSPLAEQDGSDPKNSPGTTTPTSDSA